MDPPPPADVLAAAEALEYRDFITVALVVPDSYSFPDNWIYVHSPDVIVGRIQNFRNWSPYMVKPGCTCLGLEYFVNVGDRLWEMDDDDLVALGSVRAGAHRARRCRRRRDGLRRAHAEGVPGLRRHLRGERRS